MNRGFDRRNSKSDSANVFEVIGNVFMVTGFGLGLYYGYARLEGLDEAVLGRHSVNYVAPDSRTEIVEDDEVNDEVIEDEPSLIQKVVKQMITEEDQTWLTKLIEKEVAK